MKFASKYLAPILAVGLLLPAGLTGVAASSAKTTGVVEWSAKSGFYWATDAGASARLRLVSEDTALLRAMLSALQQLRLDAQNRLAWRLMAETRAHAQTQAQAGWQGSTQAGAQVDGGTVAVVAAETALDVLATIDPALAAKVRAHLEAAGRSQLGSGASAEGSHSHRGRAEAAASAKPGVSIGLHAGASAGFDVDAAGEATRDEATGEAEASGSTEARLSLGVRLGSGQP